MAVERLEAEADRRAVEGVLEPVFYQGEECGQVRLAGGQRLRQRGQVVPRPPDRVAVLDWAVHYA